MATEVEWVGVAVDRGRADDVRVVNARGVRRVLRRGAVMTGLMAFALGACSDNGGTLATASSETIAQPVTIANSTANEATQVTTQPGSDTTPTTPAGAQGLPDGVTLVTGDILGDPYQTEVPRSAIADRGDFTVAYYGGTETDDGVQAGIELSSDEYPSAFVNAAVGERFGFAGSVFEVNGATTVTDLVLDIWRPSELAGVVPYYDEGVEPVAERPDAEPIEVVALAPEQQGSFNDPLPGGVSVWRAGGADNPSWVLIYSPDERESKNATVRIGDRFSAFGWVFEVTDSVKDESVTFLAWDTGA